VLSIGAATGSDDEHFGNLPAAEYQRIKEDLDNLHKRKIDLADEILVLDVDGYIGESTINEIIHADRLRKDVRLLEPISREALGRLNAARDRAWILAHTA
jgi:MinD-like ATPase involved in chromosome partitioning or flagellar assembly